VSSSRPPPETGLLRPVDPWPAAFALASLGSRYNLHRNLFDGLAFFNREDDEPCSLTTADGASQNKWMIFQVFVRMFVPSHGNACS
jgi:hypothetical protein